MVSYTIDTMTSRLTTFTDTAVKHADMHVKPSKTFTRLVCTQEEVKPATPAEIKAVESEFKCPCSFKEAGCTACFETEQVMQTHRATYTYNYNTTEEQYAIEEIQEVFGKSSRKLFRVKWAGYDGVDTTSWVPEHLLRRDDYNTIIDDFWKATVIDEHRDFYPDPDDHPRCWVCGWSSKSNNQCYLKAHLTRTGHHWSAQRERRTHSMVKRKFKLQKILQQQESKPHVFWGSQQIKNS